MWDRESGGSLDLIPIVSDLDVDGVNEMIVPVGNEIFVYRMARSGAELLWKASGMGKTTPSFSKSVVVADMGGDAQKEIVVAEAVNGKPALKVLDYAGQTVWMYVFDQDLQGNALGFTANALIDWLAADVNGDGVNDLYAALQNSYPSGRSVIIDGATRTLMYITDPTVEVQYANHPTNKPQRAMLPSPGNAAAMDTDGDGAEEIYFIALETYVKLDYNSTTGAVDLDYHVAQVSAQNTVIYYHTPMLSDVDGDTVSAGPEHIISGGFNSFSVFSNELPVPGQPLAFPTKLWGITMPVTEYNDNDTPKNYGDNDIMRRMQGIGDVDGDGIQEIALQYTTDDDRGDDKFRGILYSYDASNGAVEWKLDLKPAYGGQGVTARDIVSADIDGDGRDEFIVTTNTGWVLAVNGESDDVLSATGQSRVLWSVSLSVSLGAAAIADADNDGFVDVLVPAEDGFIHVIGKETLPAITAVSSNVAAQRPNEMQLAAITVNTEDIADGTPVMAKLVDAADPSRVVAVSDAVYAVGNQAVVPLIVPNTIEEGSYRFEVSASTAVDRSVSYLVTAEAPAATAAIVFENGTMISYSADQLRTLSTIETDGILMIPTGLTVQADNGVAIRYSAAQGLYVGGSLSSKAAKADITLRSSAGPVVLDGAAVESSTGSNNIAIEAGTSISAKGTRLATKNSGTTSLTADDNIDVSGADVETSTLLLSLGGASSNIVTDGADFHGIAPQITAQ